MLARTLTSPGAMMTPSVVRPPGGPCSGIRSPTSPPATATAVVRISKPDDESLTMTVWPGSTSRARSRWRSSSCCPAPTETRSLRPTASAGSSSRNTPARPETLAVVRSSELIRVPLARGRAATSAVVATGRWSFEPSATPRGVALAPAVPVRTRRTQGLGAAQVSSTSAQLPSRGATCGVWSQSGSPRKGAVKAGAATPASSIAFPTSSATRSPLIRSARPAVPDSARPSASRHPIPMVPDQPTTGVLSCRRTGRAVRQMPSDVSLDPGGTGPRDGRTAGQPREFPWTPRRRP